MSTAIRSCTIGMVLALAAAHGAPAAPPTLHLTHRSHDDAQVMLLKTRLNMCRLERQSFHDIKRSQPAIYEQMLRDMRRSRPAYDPNRAVAPEPDWTTVAVEEQDEYFAQTKYALYQRSAKYDVSEDGACALVATKVEAATIDDGETIYRIDLVAKKGHRHPSVSKAAAPDVRRMTIAARAVDVRGMAAQVQSLAQTVGQDRIAGEACNYVAVAFAKNSKVCFWSELPQYPGHTVRPVILKSVVQMGKIPVVQEVVQFRRPAAIDPMWFTPPSDIAWRGP